MVNPMDKSTLNLIDKVKLLLHCKPLGEILTKITDDIDQLNAKIDKLAKANKKTSKKEE